MQQFESHDLIPAGEALKILTWVSRSGLHIGARRTNELTRFPCGNETLYSRQECEWLRDSIISAADAPQMTYRRPRPQRRQMITELQ
jgi:hypothetical protein